jgi:hypothetical protein
MSFIIENESDLLNFKKWVKINPEHDIVYVYCKNYMKVYYVGYSSQYGTKKINYINNHRIIPKLNEVFNKNDKILIYLNYSENSIINFFKPNLNKNTGIVFKSKKNIETISFQKYDNPYTKTIDKLPNYLCEYHSLRYLIKPIKIYYFYSEIYTDFLKDINFNIIDDYSVKYDLGQMFLFNLPKYHKKILLHISPYTKTMEDWIYFKVMKMDLVISAKINTR